MSITDGGTDVGAAVETAPSDNSTVGAEPPSAERLDLSQFDNQVVSVKVDGQEVEVPVSELPSGYMRQSDYTKKTQELAEARKQLQQAEALANAFNADPMGTLKALNEAYNYSSSSGDEASSDWESMDPTEKRIATIEAQLQTQQAQAANNRIESEFKDLESEYGEIDRNQVTSYAIRNKVTVSDAYRLMTYDDLRKEQQRLSKEQEVLDSKRGAQIVHQGGSTQAGTVVPASNKKMSVRESYMAALKELSGR